MVSQIFLDSKVVICVHEQHCPIYMLTCTINHTFLLVTDTTSEFKHLYHRADCRSCQHLLPVDFLPKLVVKP